MPEDDFFSKGNALPSLIKAHGFELLFLRLCPGRRFSLLRLSLLRIHLIVDFEGTRRQDLEERLSIIVDIEDISRREYMFFVIDLKIKVLIGIALTREECVAVLVGPDADDLPVF